MNCPGCGKQIDIPEALKTPHMYYFDAYGGIPWHSLCVRRALESWVQTGEWIRSMREVYGYAGKAVNHGNTDSLGDGTGNGVFP